MAGISTRLRKEIIRRLVEEFDPQAVILFGSYAWGKPTRDSDLDLLVILEDSQESPLERARRAQRSLRGLLAPVDVIVKTRAEFEHFRPVFASLEAQIAEKGQFVYGSQI